ncbi:MAG TPA: CHAD domain-containing protein [Steroidobacteraceae bacterium]
MASRRGEDLVQEVLSRLQQSLDAQLSLLLHAVTPEGVHKTRICIRRLRVALRTMKHQLRPPQRKRYLLALRRFSSDLERAREAVALESAAKALIEHSIIVDHSQVPALLSVLATERTRSRQELRKLIATRGWRRRAAQIARYSSEHLTIDPSATSLLTIRDIIARRQRRLRTALRNVGSKPHKLHRLRLRIKQTRYLDEDFGSLLSQSPDRELKRLRQLQDRLGELHDNFNLRKWLRSQSANQALARNLCGALDARQAQLLKAIDHLSKMLRKDPTNLEIAA